MAAGGAMAKIRCHQCDFCVSSEDHKQLKLMTDIQVWINYILSVHLQQGQTARHLNRAKDCPPCPSCAAVGTWENVV